MSYYTITEVTERIKEITIVSYMKSEVFWFGLLLWVNQQMFVDMHCMLRAM